MSIANKTEHEKIADLLYPNNKLTVEEIENIPKTRFGAGASCFSLRTKPNGVYACWKLFSNVYRIQFGSRD